MPEWSTSGYFVYDANLCTPVTTVARNEKGVAQPADDASGEAPAMKREGEAEAVLSTCNDTGHSRIYMQHSVHE